MTKRRSGTKRVSDSQVSLGTEYQSRAERPSDRSLVVVPIGTGDDSVPVAKTWYPRPSTRPGTTLSWHPGQAPTRLLVERRELLESSDVKALPAMHWPSLPLRATLRCLPLFTPLPCYVTNSKAVWSALRRRKQAVFGVLEWAALVSAYENYRANPVSLSEWCEYKCKTPTWRVSKLDAVGVIGDALEHPQGSLLGAVLDGWGLELVGVAFGAEVPL